MLIKSFFFVCLCSIGMLAPRAVRTQELISARVLSSDGQVEIRRSSTTAPQMQKIAFKVNDPVRAGDTIITGRGGRLVLSLSDGSQAVIAPQTTVVIQDLTQSPRTLFNMIRGKTRIHIEKLGGQPNPYRVNTPTAVIAVRGTIFDVIVKTHETQVFLHEGEVIVTNLNLPDQPVTLLAGQMTRVLQLRLPELPSPFGRGRNDGPTQGIGRVATQGRPDSGQSRPDAIQTKPDFGRNGSPPNGGSKPAGKRP